MNDIREEMKSFFTGYWGYMAVRAACKLNLFEAIADKPRNIAQIASSLHCLQGPLQTLLSALQQMGMVHFSDEVYSLSPKSELLTASHPHSLKYACLIWGEEQMSAWQNLDYSIKTGNSAFEKIYGLPFFDFLDQHRDKSADYHKAMREYARDDYARITEIVDFSRHKSLMDVGGGYGVLVQNIKRKNPDMVCYLFDLPQVINGSETDGIEIIGGDFFQGIPPVAEAMVLSRVIHDWEDEKASQIIRNCYDSLPEGGIFYLIENFTDLMEDDASILSLNMLAICKSYERTVQQYQLLLIKAGFRIEEYLKLNQLQHILIAQK